jgi:nucleoside-diphosphate-sugar epimerase
MTGASGVLGSPILKKLEENFTVVKLGRSDGDYPWELGVELDPTDFLGIDAVLHLAWSLSDRENDFHKNVGGTAQLARFAKELGIPFIFVSSIAALGDSYYGRSKRQAEIYVEALGGVTVRAGLVREASKYFSESRCFRIGFVPNLNGYVHLTEVGTLISLLIDILKNRSQIQTSDAQIKTLITSVEPVQDFFRTTGKLNVKIPDCLIEIFLFLWSRFDLTGRNYQDSYRSLKSTLERK